MGKYAVRYELLPGEVWRATFGGPDGVVTGEGASYEHAKKALDAAVDARWPDLHPTFVHDLRIRVGAHEVLLDDLLTPTRVLGSGPALRLLVTYERFIDDRWRATLLHDDRELVADGDDFAAARAGIHTLGVEQWPDRNLEIVDIKDITVRGRRERLGRVG